MSRLVFSLWVCFVCSLAWAGDAQPRVRLLTGFGLTPDGKTLVFSWRGDLWSVATSGGVATRLSSHPAQDTRPHVSPDGRWIAFNSTRGGADQVWIMDIRGHGARSLDTHAEGSRVYGWFPDGQALLARVRRDHHWRRPNRLVRWPVTDPDALPTLLFDDYATLGSISPDQQRVAFTREGGAWWRKGYRGSAASQLWLFHRGTRSFEHISTGDHEHRWPLWLPDGEHLLYVAAPDGTANLFRRHLPSGTAQQLTHYTDDGVSFPTLSADGTTVVFRQGFDVHRLVLDGKASPVPIDIRAGGDASWPRTEHATTKRATEVVFSDDGREMAFVAGGDIWVMDTNLREPRRVTHTAAPERSPVFSGDGNTLYFLSDVEGQSDLWSARREDDTLYWWQNDAFAYARLTNDPHVERDLRRVPGAREPERLAFTRGSGGLWWCDSEGDDIRPLVRSWDAPSFDFSPDGTWLAYALSDDDFNHDVWIRPVDGETDGGVDPVNVSKHPDNDGNPKWSPDGSMLAFTGRRWGQESDICIVFLHRDAHEESPRDRRVAKALDAMAKRKEKDRKKPSQAAAWSGTWTGTLRGPPPLPAHGLTLTLVITDGKTARVTVPHQMDAIASLKVGDNGATLTLQADTTLGRFDVTLRRQEREQNGGAVSGTWRLATWSEGSLTLTRTKSAQALTPDTVRIEDRVRRIRIEGTRESGLFWSHDSKKLAFHATVDGVEGLYAIAPPDEVKPERLVKATGTHARWLSEDDQIVWLADGIPSRVTSKGKLEKFPFTVRQAVDIAKRHECAFDLAWRHMRDVFYDASMAGKDWLAMRAKYRPLAASCATRDELAHLVNLMLGELNASHMGFRALGGAWKRPGWVPQTGHLGLRFDRSASGPGLLVRHVVRDGPTDRSRSRVQVGERILAIDGRPVDATTDIDRLLTTDTLRDVRLTVRGSGNDEDDDSDKRERTVTVRPVTYGAIRNLGYDEWAARMRARVDEASQGTLGYLHVRGMNWSSFERFEAELYKLGHGKDGLIIDVRENGGGFTTDHLLTCLTQPSHAFTVPRGGGRGYPQDRMVYARWAKPIVVLCNQHSFSNAEIFAHAIKTLRRGRVVGVQTAGGVISTGSTRILDVATLRMPFRGWFVGSTGHDMELNGCVPDIQVLARPEDGSRGVDRQLDAAVAALLEDVRSWKAEPRPQPRTAPKPPR